MNKAFSLVELSIVLVILGLLTGGILAGQSLIRASELRSIVSDSQRYIAATQSFRDKYFIIPGDISSATSFWGKDNTYCAGHTGTAATPGTCNGNANGTLNTSGVGNATGEIFRFFQHLQLAGLIEGSYSGVSGAANGHHSVVGTNVPTSKLTNAAWSVYNYGSTGDSVNYATEHGNFLCIGGIVANDMPQGPALRPEEAWNIDSKLDDGKPANGNVISNAWNNLCSVADDGGSANNDLNASYKLSDTALRCALYFRRSF